MKKKLLFYGTLVAVAIIGIGLVYRSPVVGSYARGWLNPA